MRSFVATLVLFSATAVAVVAEQTIFIPGQDVSGQEHVSASEKHLRGGVAGIDRSLSTKTQVDVMFLYTSDALEEMDSDTIESKLDDELADANEAMDNSKIDLEFRAVYKGQAPNSQTSFKTNEILSALTSDEDVATLRNEHSADLVVLVMHKTEGAPAGANSIARGNNNDDIAFAVLVTTGLGNGNYALAHELGHLLGADHDRSNTNSQSDYAHGRRYCEEGGFRTIMAYPCAYVDGPVPSVPHYSNPYVKYDGRRTGSARMNNARAIRDNMEDVSAYRS